jgi:hypothetical protein
MKRHLEIFAPLRLCAFALIFVGCASPHRMGLTTHTVEVFRGRADGLISREEWRDSERGGGLFLFTDPTVQSMTATHTNQSALGGGSSFVAGPMAVVLDTNTEAVIGAGGTAIGNVIGAAVKAAVK